MANVSVIPFDIVVTKEDEFNLNVYVDPFGSQISGMQSDIIFNSSVVNVNSITEGDLLKQEGLTFFSPGTIDNVNGTVTSIFSIILGLLYVTTPGTFVTINLKATGIGTSDIMLSNTMIIDPNGVLVPINITNGKVTVNPVCPTLSCLFTIEGT